MTQATGGSASTTVITSPGLRTTYTTHIFTTSGNLTVSEGGSVEYLVVGAGGGGGSDMGGGGGAGGFLTGNTTVSAGTYSITIGAGGTGGPAGVGQVRGSNGSSSSFVPFGFKGHSYSFDGSGDGVNCGTQSAFAIGSGAFCLEGWIYNHRLKDFATLWTTRPDNGSYADAYHIGWSGVGGASLYVGTTPYAGVPSGTIKAGQWQHIAVTRNASGNLAFFVDGVRAGYTASFTTNFTRSLLGLGDFPTTKAESIDGYISNARIVVGNAVYDPTLTTCTVPTAPLTAIAGTVILTAQDLSFRDNSANNFTLTAQGNTMLSHYSPFHSLGAAGGGGGASEYSNNNSPAASGASGGGVASYISTTNGLGISGQGFAGGTNGGAYYPGGGGGAGGAGSNTPGNGGIGRTSNILGTTYYWAGGGGGAGYSGNAGNGGLGGGGGGAPKVSGGGLAGGSAYNAASDGTAGSLGSQTNVPGGNGGTNTGGGGGGGAHYNSNNFGGTGGSGIVILRYVSLVEPVGSGGLGGPNAGGGGGAGNDGYLGRTVPYTVKVFTSSANLVVNSSSTVEYLVVGGGGGGGSDMGGGGGAGGYLAGNITLSAGTYLVTVGAGGTGGPAGTDQVRANNGTSSGIVPFNYKGHSCVFDSTGDLLSVSAQTALSFDTGDFTIEGWIYLLLAPSGYAAFIDARNVTTDAYAFGVYNISSSLKLDFYYGSAGRVTSTTSVPINQWVHCAVSRSSGTIRLFINGVLDATTGSYASAINAARSIQIFGALIDPGFFSGAISNLRVVKGTAVYTSTFTVPTGPLTAITNTSLLIAQDLTLRDNSSNNFTVSASGNATTSHFSPFTNLGAAGGGGGASDHSAPPATSSASWGGSGGGASGNSANNGLGIPGQGNQGAASAGAWYPGGGGGAGGAGATNPATGGNGLQNAILGTSYYWAAGGGGAGYSGNPGNGGLGGGGGGAPKQSSTVGVAGASGYNAGTDATSGSLNSQTNVPGGNGGTNTGSGGGGGAHYSATNQGGSGGSGIVIIKYRDDQASITTSSSVSTLVISQLDTIYGGGQGANGINLTAGSPGTLYGGGGGGSGTLAGGGGGGIGLDGVRDGFSLGGNAGGTLGGDGQGGVFGYAGSNGNGGLWGGGGAGTTNGVVDPSVGNGANGALLIIWQGNILQYPTALQANNVTAYGTPWVQAPSGNINQGLLRSNLTIEVLESGVSGNVALITTVENRVLFEATANSNVGLLTDSLVGANIRAVMSVTSVGVTPTITSVNNVAVQELQIITYRPDDEMMLVTVQNTGGYTNSAQRIDRITDENDPRKIKAYLLNYIVGVTGENNDIIQTQIWY